MMQVFADVLVVVIQSKKRHENREMLTSPCIVFRTKKRTKKRNEYFNIFVCVTLIHMTTYEFKEVSKHEQTFITYE